MKTKSFPQNIKGFSLIVITLLMLTSLLVAENDNRQYIISSGSYGGNYYKTGNFISKVLNEFHANYKFSVIESNGSYENIKNLRSGFADFTIIQRNILLQNLYNESEGIKNIEVLLPLFQETLLIYIRDSSAITFDEFRRRIEKSEIKSIGITNMKGFSYEIFITISKLLHIRLPENIFHEDDYNSLINQLNNNSIDALISFSLPIIEIEAMKKTSQVYFNKQEIELLENRITNISKVELGDGNDAYTLGSWTFLIGLNESIFEIESNTKSIVTHLTHSIETGSGFIPDLIKKNLKLYKRSENQYKLSMNSIPVNRDLTEYFHYRNNTLLDYLEIVIIVCLALLAIYLLKISIDRFDTRFIRYRFRHIIIGVLLVSFFYLLSIEFLVQAELKFYEELDIKSQLLNMTKNDLHFWILIRNLTGNDSGIFPLSSLGKLMISFSSYILWFGALFIGISEYSVYSVTKKRKKGMLKLNFKEHIVIVGWNGTTNKLVVETINAINNYRQSSEKIVCITTKTEEILSKHKDIAMLHANKKIDFIHGEARDEHVLELANVHIAKTVVLLAEDNTISADEKTLLRALEISRYCRKIAVAQNPEYGLNEDFESYNVEKYIDSIYIIAEINDDKYKKDLLNSDVNEIISTSNYGNNILTQSMLNHGVSKVLDEILEFNEFNEFYQIDLLKKKNHHLRNKTFDELLIAFRKQKILLIAVKVVYRDQNGKEIIDYFEIEKLLERDGLRKQVIVNPYTEIATKRKVDADDQLIVFAKNSKVLKDGIKKTTFA